MTDDMTTSTEGTIKARAGISGRNLVREGRNLVSVGAGAPMLGAINQESVAETK
jgi:hypothetical protein